MTLRVARRILLAKGASLEVDGGGMRVSAEETYGRETAALLAAHEKATVILLEVQERTASESAAHVLAAA
jgi:hypothetical protein